MSYVPTAAMSSQSIPHPTSVAIGGNRVLTATDDGHAVYATASSIPDSCKILGISIGAVSSGVDVSVQSYGIIDDSTWNWVAGQPIYLGLNGLLTQTVPTKPSSSFSLIVAYPITSTKIFINIKDAILLG